MTKIRFPDCGNTVTDNELTTWKATHRLATWFLGCAMELECIFCSEI